MIVQLNVKESPRCLHMERMRLENLDATMMVASAYARQVQRRKGLVPFSIITDIIFTSIQEVTIMSFVDSTVPNI